MARRHLQLRGHPVRYIGLALALMAATYAFLYFPYPPGSWPVRLLQGYLRLIAGISGLAAGLFDPTIRTHGDVVQGRFALQIVLDCGALDAHALFASAVAAFPVPWRRRVVGIAAGSALVAAANIARIVSLYAIGLHWPAAFHVAHEEIFQFGIIAVALVAFWAWTAWAREPRPAVGPVPPPEAAASLAS